MKNPRAHLKYLKISPIKLRRIANLVRGKQVNSALSLLKNLPHKGADILYDIVNSVKHNALNNSKIDTANDMIVSTLMVNEGPTMKRYQARARGRMFQILKRTSHVYVELANQGDK